MLKNLQSWLGEPWKQPMSALDWFLIVGLVLICVALWSIILKHIFEAVGE